MTPAAPPDPPLAPARFAALGRRVARAVRERLCAQPAAGETLADPADLKSGHRIDGHAIAVVREALAGERCNVRIEGGDDDIDPEAAFCLYIDPVDGSLNWDRGIGDPAVALAIAAGPEAECLDDLVLAYVEGLRTGDRYWMGGDGAVYHDDAVRETTAAIGCTGPEALAQATAYLRCGYGGARPQLAASLALMLAARDVRAVDNAAMECAEIARGAADLLVEARGISDGYNLLAYPLARAAGATLVDLDGADLGPQPFRPDEPMDYVLAGNPGLAGAAIDLMQRCAPDQRHCVAALAERLGLG